MTIKFQVEEGPLSTPDFLVSLAKKKLRSAADSTEDRARAAFSAGYWFRVACTCGVSLTSSYNPVFPWMVQKDRGVSNFARTSARKEAERLCQSLEVVGRKTKLRTEQNTAERGAKTGNQTIFITPNCPRSCAPNLSQGNAFPRAVNVG